MVKFILKRLVQMAVVLVVVSMLIFAMVRITPSDPIASLTNGKDVGEEVRQQLTEYFYLDKSVPEQYVIWFSGVLNGNFGESYQYRQAVSSLISQRISTTLSLVLLSGVIAMVIAIPVGVVSAIKMNTWVDKVLSIFSLLFVASPVFLTSVILMYIFAFKIPIFPSFGTGTGLWDSLYHMVLPATALAMNMVALTSRITRTSMIEQLNSDYIRTATAKGISRGRVVVTYALKNALIPIITVSAIHIGAMLVGAVLAESVFAMGGLGSLLTDAIKAADYPVVQGVSLLMVTVFLCINFVVDIFYAVLDPRIRMN